MYLGVERLHPQRTGSTALMAAGYGKAAGSPRDAGFRKRSPVSLNPDELPTQGAVAGAQFFPVHATWLRAAALVAPVPVQIVAAGVEPALRKPADERATHIE